MRWDEMSPLDALHGSHGYEVKMMVNDINRQTDSQSVR